MESESVQLPGVVVQDLAPRVTEAHEQGAHSAGVIVRRSGQLRQPSVHLQNSINLEDYELA